MATVNAKSRCWVIYTTIAPPFLETIPALGCSSYYVYPEEGTALHAIWYKLQSQQRMTYFQSHFPGADKIVPVTADQFKSLDKLQAVHAYKQKVSTTKTSKQDTVSFFNESDSDNDDPVPTRVAIQPIHSERMSQDVETEEKTATLEPSPNIDIDPTILQEVASWIQSTRDKKREAQQEIERATKKIKMLEKIIQEKKRCLKNKPDPSVLLRLSNALE